MAYKLHTSNREDLEELISHQTTTQKPTTEALSFPPDTWEKNAQVHPNKHAYAG